MITFKKLFLSCLSIFLLLASQPCFAALAGDDVEVGSDDWEGWEEEEETVELEGDEPEGSAEEPATEEPADQPPAQKPVADQPAATEAPAAQPPVVAPEQKGPFDRPRPTGGPASPETIGKKPLTPEERRKQYEESLAEFQARKHALPKHAKKPAVRPAPQPQAPEIQKYIKKGTPTPTQAKVPEPQPRTSKAPAKKPISQ